LPPASARARGGSYRKPLVRRRPSGRRTAALPAELQTPFRPKTKSRGRAESLARKTARETAAKWLDVLTAQPQAKLAAK